MFLIRQFSSLFCALIGAGLLFACAQPSYSPEEIDTATLAGLAGYDQSRLLVPARTPPLIANTPEEILDVATVARRLTPERLASARGSRMIEVAALPWLRSAPEGMAFLSAAAPKALARGAPDSSCPVAKISKPYAKTAEEAAISALSQCVAALSNTSNCGCQLIAMDSVVLAPRTDLSFAPSVTATLINGEASTRLVADQRSENADGEVTLRHASGYYGVIQLSNDQAEMTLAAQPGKVFTGHREKFGYRRGRVAERLVLTSQSGEKLTVLIGVEYRDVSKSEG